MVEGVRGPEERRGGGARVGLAPLRLHAPSEDDARAQPRRGQAEARRAVARGGQEVSRYERTRYDTTRHERENHGHDSDIEHQ